MTRAVLALLAAVPVLLTLSCGGDEISTPAVPVATPQATPTTAAAATTPATATTVATATARPTQVGTATPVATAAATATATQATAGATTPAEDRRQRRATDERYLRSICLALQDFRGAFIEAGVLAEEVWREPVEGADPYLKPFVELFKSLRVATPPDDLTAYHSAFLNHNQEVIDLIRAWDGPLEVALHTWWRSPFGALFSGFGWMQGATQYLPATPRPPLARFANMVGSISECAGNTYLEVFLSAGQTTSSEVVDRERWLVEKAIAFYEAHGHEATVEHYRGPAALDGSSYVFMLEAETARIVAHPSPELLGKAAWETDSSGFQFRALLSDIEPNGARVLYTLQTGDDGTGWVRRHNELIFGAGRTDCIPRFGNDPPDNPRFIPRIESCPLPRYASSTQTYDTYDPTGEVMTPGSYAFLFEVDDRSGVAVSHHDLRWAVNLLVHPRDEREEGLYDAVEAGDIVEWGRVDNNECWHRYRVTEVLPDLPGEPPRKQFAVEWLHVFLSIPCEGPLADGELTVEMRWSPPPARPGSNGIPTMLGDQPVEGAGTYRAAPFSALRFDLPPGLRLVRYTGFLTDGQRPIGLEDIDSGSALIVSGVNGKELGRLITLEGLWRNVGALFDAIIESAQAPCKPPWRC